MGTRAIPVGRHGKICLVQIVAALFLQTCLSGPAGAAECNPGQSECREMKPKRPAPYQAPRQIERLPAPGAPATRGPVVPSAPAQPPAVPAPPALVTSCDAGGCRTAQGERMEGGAAGGYLNGSGRPCHRIGPTMQCF